MVVRETDDFKGRKEKLDDWKIKLQEDFPFMEQNPTDDSNVYRR